MKNKYLASFYNLLHIFKKDKGAHFAYNLGVSLMRASLFMILLGFAILIISLCLDSFRLEYVGEYKALARIESTTRTINTKYRNEPVYLAHFTCMRNGKEEFKVDEYISEDMYYSILPLSILHSPQPYQVYRVVFNKGGEDMLYVTDKGRTNTSIDYAKCYNKRLHLPLSGMWLSFLAAFVLVLLGRKQMNLGLKYPRSDIPEVVSGAPVVADPENDIRQRAANAVYEDMKPKETKTLTITETNTKYE